MRERLSVCAKLCNKTTCSIDMNIPTINQNHSVCSLLHDEWKNEDKIR